MALNLAKSFHEHAHELECLYNKSRGNGRRKIRSPLNSGVAHCPSPATVRQALQTEYSLSNAFKPLDGLAKATEDARIFALSCPNIHRYFDVEELQLSILGTAHWLFCRRHVTRLIVAAVPADRGVGSCRIDRPREAPEGYLHANQLSA
jgi:hypothetical protein